jgi:NitT/TauT family transport system substrate-binding protein/sulfonate transport system substrate-binding protein
MTTSKQTAPDRTRRRLSTALLSLAGVSLAGTVRAQAPAADPSVLRVGYIGTGKVQVAPSGWALQQGILARELKPLGISGIKTYPFPNGPDLNEALGSGALDLGLYGDTPAIVARARGFGTRLIGFETVGMDAWLLTPKGGAKTLAELKGKVLAVPLGSYMHRYVIGALKEAGLAGQVRVAYMLARDAEPALSRGDIDAFAAQIDVGPLLAQRGYPILDQASRHKNLVGTSVIIATDKILGRYPGLPQAWHRARREAVAEMRKEPERYYDFHSKSTSFPVDVVRISYPLEQFSDEPFPARGLELLDSAKRFLLAEGLVKQDFALDQWQLASANIAAR